MNSELGDLDLGAAAGAAGNRSRPATPERRVGVYEEDDPYIQAIYKRAQFFWDRNTESAKIGPRGLPEHPTPNESLFFFRILFFPSMNLQEIYDKFERLGMLRNDDMEPDSIARLLSPTIEGEGNRPVYTYKQVEKMLAKYENEATSVNFRTIERFVSSLRTYLLYGKKYLVWQDFKEAEHCKGGVCFYLIYQDDYPEGELVMKLNKSDKLGYMPPINHINFREEVFEHPAMRRLFQYVDKDNTSDEVLEMIAGTQRKMLKRRIGLAVGGKRRKTRRPRRKTHRRRRTSS